MCVCRMKLQSQPIRMKGAAHLDELLSKSKGGVCKNATTHTLIFKTAASLLEQGSIESRTHAKRIIFALKRFLPPSTLATLLPHAGNPIRDRRVAATLELLGPPEAPPRLAQSFAFVSGWDAAVAYAQHVNAPLPKHDNESSGGLTGRMDSLTSQGGASQFGLGSTGLGSSALHDTGIRRQLSRAPSRSTRERAPSVASRSTRERVPSVAPRRLSRYDSTGSGSVALQAQGSGIRVRGTARRSRDQEELGGDQQTGQSAIRSTFAC